jgi:hypothetical protein
MPLASVQGPISDIRAAQKCASPPPGEPGEPTAAPEPMSEPVSSVAWPWGETA